MVPNTQCWIHIEDDRDLVRVDNPKQDRSNLKLDLFVSVLFWSPGMTPGWWEQGAGNLCSGAEISCHLPFTHMRGCHLTHMYYVTSLWPGLSSFCSIWGSLDVSGKVWSVTDMLTPENTETQSQSEEKQKRVLILIKISLYLFIF